MLQHAKQIARCHPESRNSRKNPVLAYSTPRGLPTPTSSIRCTAADALYGGIAVLVGTISRSEGRTLSPEGVQVGAKYRAQETGIFDARCRDNLTEFKSAEAR